MVINNEALKDYKDKLERKIMRNEEKISNYEERLNMLSIHGHWSLGYFMGLNCELENLLDDISELMREQ